MSYSVTVNGITAAEGSLLPGGQRTPVEACLDFEALAALSTVTCAEAESLSYCDLSYAELAKSSSGTWSPPPLPFESGTDLLIRDLCPVSCNMSCTAEPASLSGGGAIVLLTTPTISQDQIEVILNNYVSNTTMSATSSVQQPILIAPAIATNSPRGIHEAVDLSVVMTAGSNYSVTWTIDGVSHVSADLSTTTSFPRAGNYSVIANVSNSLGWEVATAIVTVEEPISDDFDLIFDANVFSSVSTVFYMGAVRHSPKPR
jgi:hypothetical protein